MQAMFSHLQGGQCSNLGMTWQSRQLHKDPLYHEIQALIELLHHEDAILQFHLGQGRDFCCCASRVPVHHPPGRRFLCACTSVPLSRFKMPGI